MNRKKLILLLLILLIPTCFLLSSKTETKQTRRNFNVYLKNGDEYVLQESSSFPKTGYVLNTTESKCTNGGTISQDATTKEITVEVSKSDKCNFYFDSEVSTTLNKLHSLNSTIEVKTTTPDFSKISPLPTAYQDNGIGTTEESYTPPVNTSYITYADNYTFDTTTGEYTLTNPQTCKWDECYADLTGKYYTYNELYTDTNLHNQSNQQNLYQITSNSTNTKIYYKSASKTATAYDESDTGLFSMEDDYGQSLYFRGNVENNYVKFGKDKNNNDMYWRIVRINGDGTLRLIYDGTEAHNNGESSTDRTVGTSGFNSGTGSPYDAGYVGYMYGDFDLPTGCSNGTCTSGGSTSYEEAHANTNSSTIKTYLENWYLENIVNTGYESHISDEIFCNDRSMRSGDLGYGENITYFGAYTRLWTNKNPSLKCPQKNDAFTKNAEIGNAKLGYPVGLITADEMVIAGNIRGESNYKSYLYKGSWYWSLSPTVLSSIGYAGVMYLSTNISSHNTSISSGGVAPVINLKAEYLNGFSGDGTRLNPFTVNS